MVIKEEQMIFIQNAGLVILQAYLPYFFDKCNLFADGKFKSDDAAKRGALLLQYVFNKQTKITDQELVLNKLLCGLAVGGSLPSEIEPTADEKETISQLFDAIITHWTIIKNSSHDGFRESWLRREGKLIKKGEHWELTLEQRAYDILLDHVPFSLSPVKYSWMKEPIVVIWR